MGNVVESKLLGLALLVPMPSRLASSQALGILCLLWPGRSGWAGAARNLGSSLFQACWLPVDGGWGLGVGIPWPNPRSFLFPAVPGVCGAGAGRGLGL